MSDYDSIIVAAGPKAYWPCQEPSGFPKDISGNGLDITNIGPVVPSYHVDGAIRHDYAVGFTSGSLFYRNPASLAVNNLTAEMWIALLGGSGSSRQFYGWDGSGFGGFYLTTNSAGAWRAVIGGTGSLLSIAANALTGSYCHLVVVRDAGTWKYYFNGALDTANAGSATPSTPSVLTFFGANDGSLQVRMAHVAMYERVLSADEIKAHYEARLLGSRVMSYVN